MSYEPLHIKYRPQTLDEIVGHPHIVNSLKTILPSESRPHTYLLTGGPGQGKTTTARIIAREVGAQDVGVVEIDAGTSGSAEAIRDLVEDAQYMPMTGKSKVFIVDEAHVMSKTSWGALLKATEDVQDHAYYIFCTSEDSKVPTNIRTRCAHYDFAPVAKHILKQYAEMIAEFEGITLPEGGFEVLAEEANGSPRQLLVYLSQSRTATDLDELRKLVSAASIAEEDGVIQIAKLLMFGNKNVNEYQKALEACTSFGGAKVILKSWFGNQAVKKLGDLKMAKLMESIEKLPEFPSEKTGKFDLALMINRFLLTN